MCQNILAGLGKLDISRKFTERLDVASPWMKSMGMSGVLNPANEIKAKLDGTKTLVTKKSEAAGLAIATDNRNAAYNRLLASSQPGHVQAIASRKARLG